MKILITGSGGFIGSHLMKALDKTKHTKLGVDKKFGIDITNFQPFFTASMRLMGGKPDLIVHLAAQTSTKQSIEKPQLDFNDNVIGTFNVCEVARFSEAKVIYISSRKATLGAECKGAPYGLSKYVGELYFKEWAKSYGIKPLITRLGNVYGPGQEGSAESFWLAWFIEAS